MLLTMSVNAKKQKNTIKKGIKKNAAKKSPVKKGKSKRVAKKKTAKKLPGRHKTYRSKVTVPKANNLNDDSDIVYTNGSGKPIEGRPPQSAKLTQITSLAAIGCTHQEIAAICGMSKDTFTILKKNNPSVVKAIEFGKAQGCGSLRKRQYEVAMSGNPDMLKFLGKNRLNQSDRLLMSAEISEGDSLRKAMMSVDSEDEDDPDEY